MRAAGRGSPPPANLTRHRETSIGIGEIALLALLGVGVGTYGTLVGVGGGFLVVPALLLLYQLEPAAAAATSLVVVFLNATSGSVSYLRRGRVDLRTGVTLALATVPGALIGPAIAVRLPERAFRAFFGLFLLAMAVVLFRSPDRAAAPAGPAPAPGRWRVHRTFTDRSGATFSYSYNLPVAIALSMLVGVLSSTMGIGGGIVHVPMLIHVMSFPVHVATATSQFVLAVTALAGVVEYTSRGAVVWSLAGAIGAGVVVGAQIGAALSRRIRGPGIVRLLTVAIVLLAGRLLWSALRGS